ncbi:copper chaperone PCu(A)C [Nocardiopsis changdeensis]|uniref:Copper chaperone PCu(A)C n=1 Tax=Nocardiopsis changdeensis TaxID=2831969 RepID=A0ABX8BSN0_9ACTN|nr:MULTISPECIES: copper chaperone PCu(A)C [Nocardiopsis]QUX25061.1 copper chaperone PCu(A)C [Nocardiopsis changdeensis]QYX35447.1 copper chaperone PCu(A)C [Nocardiopsis sp. MT53]
MRVLNDPHVPCVPDAPRAWPAPQAPSVRQVSRVPDTPQAPRTPRVPRALRSVGVSAALAAALLFATACGAAEAPTAAEASPEASRGHAVAGDLEVSGAWVPEPANPEVAVLYLEVANAAARDAAITGVSTDASPDADLCSTETTDSGASGMRVVEEIPVAAGGATALVDGGYHIMLNDLPEPLEVGDGVEVTLTFDGDREAVFTAPVEPMTAGSAPEADHGGHH